MSDKADLKRIKAHLEEAQAEIETASKIDDSLGGSLSFGFGSLLAAVGQLFTRTNDHESKIGKHDIELKLIQRRSPNYKERYTGLKSQEARRSPQERGRWRKLRPPLTLRAKSWSTFRYTEIYPICISSFR